MPRADFTGRTDAGVSQTRAVHGWARLGRWWREWWAIRTRPRPVHRHRPPDRKRAAVARKTDRCSTYPTSALIAVCHQRTHAHPALKGRGSRDVARDGARNALQGARARPGVVTSRRATPGRRRVPTPAPRGPCVRPALPGLAVTGSNARRETCSRMAPGGDLDARKTPGDEPGFCMQMISYTM